jgi:hypothetical protein
LVAANTINKIQESMTAKDKQTAIENVKKGFNPFGNMLNKIRTQATIKKEDEGDDMMDKDF